jgi:Uma2 family endonuclease
VLIGSQYKGIDVYQREGALWKQYSYREGDIVELASLEVRFPLERIYRGMRLH